MEVRVLRNVRARSLAAAGGSSPYRTNLSGTSIHARAETPWRRPGELPGLSRSHPATSVDDSLYRGSGPGRRVRGDRTDAAHLPDAGEAARAGHLALRQHD